MRTNNRKFNEIRDVKLEVGHNKYAEGSCLIHMGNTVVSCTASVDEKVPYFLRHTGNGWITAEYGMLPRSTHSRMQREAAKGQQSGRTQEIQRLIGRSLRTVVNLNLLGERQIIVDCDVIQADGGTRTASITGGYVALHLAIQHLLKGRLLRKDPILAQVAAISCGIVNNEALLDLEYSEDNSADVDANFVANNHGHLVEVQSTAEHGSFSAAQLNTMLTLATDGIQILMQKQKAALKI
jgi:ribonuclease PH